MEHYLGNLYDIGYDKPEAHAIQKNDTLYYAFYGDNYTGSIELRGLKNTSYNVTDYVNNKELGKVTGPTGHLNVIFKKYMLLKAVPN